MSPRALKFYCELARQRIRDDSPLINGAAEAGEAA